MRAYLAGLPGAEALRVEAVIREVMREAPGQLEAEDEPAVWLFTQGRRRMVRGGQPGDVLVADDADGAQDEEAATGEDPGIAVHRAFARLTIKQQEALRLKFQFGFNLVELAGITGVSHAGAGGLLHSGLVRLCQASGASVSLGDGWSRNVRLTAYALDEMEPAEKTAFAESVPDGKALLESSDAIRKTGVHLARVLASGAPLPKRRRRRKEGAWGKMPWVLLIGAVVAGAAALVWYIAGRSEKSVPRRDDTRSGMNGSYATPTRARRGEADGAGRHGDRPDVATSPFRDDEMVPQAATPRAGRSLSRSDKGGAYEQSSLAGDNAARAGGETGPAEDPGGARSRGAASGPVGNNAPAAQNRGVSGAPDGSDHPASAADSVENDTNLGREAPNGAESASGSTAGSNAIAHAMPPAKPAADSQATSEPGGGTEAGKEQPAPAPALGIATLQRELAKGHWPKPATVKVGEMVKQAPPAADDPGPTAEEPLAAKVEMARSPWAPDKTLVRVSLKARRAPVPVRPPANLVFAIDVSQSMAGANRLPLVQEGIRLLAQRLRPEDRVAVVTYAASARELLPGAPLGGKALELRNCLGALEAAGQTNGYEGLQLAYAAARRGRVESGLNVVVLCTDGNFNLGETDEGVLAGIAARAAAEGIKLSVFGFGRSDRNDLRLELLATKGGGRSCYVNTLEEAERLLATQIDGLVEAAAQEVALTVQFNPDRVTESGRVDGGAEGETSAAVAELLPGRSLEAFYEVSLKPGEKAAARLADVAMSYRLPGLPAAQRRTVRLEGVEQDWSAADPSFRFAAAWAELGRILQGERAHAGTDLDRLEAWIQRFLPDDAGGYRTELLDNLAAARLAAVGDR